MVPRSGYEFAERPDLELNDERFDLRDPEKSEMGIYIPIR